MTTLPSMSDTDGRVLEWRCAISGTNSSRLDLMKYFMLLLVGWNSNAPPTFRE